MLGGSGIVLRDGVGTHGDLKFRENVMSDSVLTRRDFRRAVFEDDECVFAVCPLRL